MRLTREDLNRIPSKTHGLMGRLRADPFVRMLTGGKLVTFFHRNPNMRESPVAVILAQLLKNGHDAVRDPEEVEASDAYLKTAQEIHQSDGDLEFDDGGRVSLSSEAGAYVQGWKWVSSADADRCDEPACHADLCDGDGWDGKCGEHVDKEETDDA